MSNIVERFWNVSSARSGDQLSLNIGGSRDNGSRQRFDTDRPVMIFLFPPPDQLDFVQFRPELASDEEAVAERVVGDAIEDIRGTSLCPWISKPVRSIHPVTCPSVGEILAMRSVCQTLA